jgi:hypothetical protein
MPLGDFDDFIAAIERLNKVLHHALKLGKQGAAAKVAYAHENDAACVKPAYRQRREVLILGRNNCLLKVASFPNIDVSGVFPRALERGRRNIPWRERNLTGAAAGWRRRGNAALHFHGSCNFAPPNRGSQKLKEVSGSLKRLIGQSRPGRPQESLYFQRHEIIKNAVAYLHLEILC